MFDESVNRVGDDSDSRAIYVEEGVLERIIRENGGIGTTPEDAKAFLEQVGADTAIVSLMWIKIEQFRLRVGKVLNRLEQYVVRHPPEDRLDMSANCKIVLDEFIDLCDTCGLIESRSIYLAYDDEV